MNYHVPPHIPVLSDLLNRHLVAPDTVKIALWARILLKMGL